MANVKRRERFPLNITPLPIGEAPEAIWTFWRRDIYLAIAGIRTRNLPTRSLVAITTTLAQLQNNTGLNDKTG